MSNKSFAKKVLINVFREKPSAIYQNAFEKFSIRYEEFNMRFDSILLAYFEQNFD